MNKMDLLNNLTKVEQQLKSNVLNIDTKKQLVDDMYNLANMLIQEVTSLQDEIEREEIGVPLKEQKNSNVFDFDDIESAEQSLNNAKESDVFNFDGYDWFNEDGDNCVVGENLIKAIIDATSKVSYIDIEVIKQLTENARTFDEIKALSIRDAICLNDFFYYTLYEFLPNTYSRILSLVVHLKDITNAGAKDKFVLNFLTYLQNVTHVRLMTPVLIKKMTEKTLILDTILLPVLTTDTKILAVDETEYPLTDLEEPDAFADLPIASINLVKDMKEFRQIESAKDFIETVNSALKGMTEDSILFSTLPDTFNSVIPDLEMTDEIASECELRDLVDVLTQLLEIDGVSFMEDTAITSFKYHLLKNDFEKA